MLFQYTKLPQGLKNSPGAFQRIVNEILGDLKGHWFWSYEDDDSVGIETAENHLREMSLGLYIFEEAGVKPILSKCHFRTLEEIFLGHEFDKNGIRSPEELVKAIRDLKEFTNGAELSRCLCLMKFLADFSEDFAHRAKPRYSVL